MKKPVIVFLCFGIFLAILGTGLLVWYAANRLIHKRFVLHIPSELLRDPPISSEPGIEKRIVHGVDPVTLFLHKPMGASNAATSYLEVVRSLEAREADGAAERLSSRAFNLTDRELEMFLDGVYQTRCDFSQESLVLTGKPVRLAPVVNVADSVGHLSWFRQVARAIVARGEEFESSGESEKAVTCYEGVVKFGYDIEKGRESLLQVLVGASVQKSGVLKLKELYEDAGDAERLQRWTDFLSDLEDFIGKFREKMNKLIRVSWMTPEAIANGLWVLEHDEDHVFRREILVGLGAARVFAPDVVGPSIERAAMEDPDPYVREAAQNALKLFDPSRTPMQSWRRTPKQNTSLPSSY